MVSKSRIFKKTSSSTRNFEWTFVKMSLCSWFLQQTVTLISRLWVALNSNPFPCSSSINLIKLDIHLVMRNYNRFGGLRINKNFPYSLSFVSLNWWKLFTPKRLFLFVFNFGHWSVIPNSHLNFRIRSVNKPGILLSKSGVFTKWKL